MGEVNREKLVRDLRVLIRECVFRLRRELGKDKLSELLRVGASLQVNEYRAGKFRVFALKEGRDAPWRRKHVLTAPRERCEEIVRAWRIMRCAIRLIRLL